MNVSDWISLFALLIAALAFGISLYELLSNKPKLRITLGQAFSQNARYVYIEVINYGRQPTTVDSVCFQKVGSKKTLWANKISQLSSDNGKYLMPGEKAKYFYNANDTGSFDGSEFNLGDAVNNRIIQARVTDTWSGKAQTAVLPNKKIDFEIS